MEHEHMHRVLAGVSPCFGSVGRVPLVGLTRLHVLQSSSYCRIEAIICLLFQVSYKQSDCQHQ